MKKLTYLLLVLVFFSLSRTVLAADKPIVGAIRWDAWYGNLDSIGQGVLTTLGPSHWHYRVPFFGRIISDTQVDWSYSQDVVDQEIAYAKRAGLTYWAFIPYQPTDHMSDAFKLYLSSSHKQDINFALMLSPQNFGDDTYGMSPFVPAKKQRLISLITDPSYQKVLGNRPLIYLGVYDAWITTWGGKAMLDELKTAIISQGLGNPYIVINSFDPATASAQLKALGADAISSYASANCGNGTSYQSLVNGVEGFWGLQKNTGLNVIPIVMAGWDRRPRVENPRPGQDPTPAPGDINIYCQKATPQEIANHLNDAITWIKNNPTTDPANAIIIYAWNENDEGGWLVPTLGDGTARIDTLGALLNPPTAKPGDLNSDGKVDIYDYNILIGNFGKTGSNLVGDINHDGKVDIYDYNLLVGNFGK